MALLPQNNASLDKKTGIYNYDRIFEKVAYVLKDSDYVVGNLETPIAGEELEYTKEPTVFNTPLAFAQSIKKAGFDFVSIANNHCLDRGVIGLKKTILNLDSIGLEYSGAYLTEELSENPFVKEIHGVKVAILAYTYGTNSKWRNNELHGESKYLVDLFRKQDQYCGVNDKTAGYRIKKYIKKSLPRFLSEAIKSSVIEDCVLSEREEDLLYLQRLKNKIQRAKQNSDIVIMCMHAGGQYNSHIGKYTHDLVYKLKEYGCDLIVCSHPHCVLNSEYIDDVYVTYSLGNFCFTPNWGYYKRGVFAEYSVVLNIYMDELKKEIVKKTVYLTKVIVDSDGNSVVYHIKDLYFSLKKDKDKRKLFEDSCSVLSRYFGKKIDSFDISSLEINIDEYI